MTTTAQRPITTTDGPPGGTPEPSDPTERPDVDPRPDPGSDDEPEADPPAS